MFVLNGEKVLIGSCDYGHVDGEFLSSLIDLFTIKDFPVNLCGNVRTTNSMLYKSREHIIKYWLTDTDAEWLLFIDSTILFEPKDVFLLCQSADSVNKKIVSGLYFTVGIMNDPIPYASAFFREEDGSYYSIKNIEENSLSLVDATGLGFLLIHRSVVKEILNSYSLSELFVSPGLGEDIAFFEKVNDIKQDVYLNTSVSLKNVKRYPVGLDFYKMYKTVYPDRIEV